MSKTAAQPATKKAAAKKSAVAKPAASPVAAEPAAAATKSAKTLTGKVVSAKMQKTITVAVERYVPHATYGKYQRRTTKFLAHDENGECREGDTVAIEECRPISRHKAWRLSRVIARGEAQVEAKP